MELSIPRVVVLRLQILTVLAFVSTLLLMLFGKSGVELPPIKVAIWIGTSSWVVLKSSFFTLQGWELALLGGACFALLLALYGLRLHPGKRVIEVREGVLSRPWSFWGWRNRRVKLERDTRVHRMRWLGQPALAVSEGFLPLVVRASEVGGEAGLQQLKLALDEERGRLFGSTLLSENLREEREIESRLSVVPWVTLAFASVAFLLYALFPLSASETEPSAFQLVFAGSWIFSDEPAFFTDWHRFASYALLHGDWEHLGVNLVVILLFGTVVERTLGRSRLVLIMTLCAAVAPLLGLALLQNHGSYYIEAGLGASAIAYGLLGSFAVLWVAKGRLLSCVQRSGLLFLVVVFLGCTPFVSVDPAHFEPSNFLHLVGLVVGAVVTAVLVEGSVRSIAPPGRALKASAAMLGLLFAAAGLRTISWADQPLPDFVDWARSRYSESSQMSSFLLYDPSLNAARRTLSEEAPSPVDVLLAAWVAADAPSPPEDLLREAIARLEELEPEDFIEICEDDSSSCESLGSKQVQEKLHERLQESREAQAEPT